MTSDLLSKSVQTLQDNAHVLLHECYDNTSLYGGGEHVELKFLPASHPFARLLLYRGSRIREATRAYALDVWRRQNIYPERDIAGSGTHFAVGFVYRRESVVWSSSYGRPVEAHLNLNQYVEAWLKAQPVAAFGLDDFPKTILGMVRLDNDEHGFGHITRDIISLRQHGARAAFSSAGNNQHEAPSTQTYRECDDDQDKWDCDSADDKDSDRVNCDVSLAAASNIQSNRMGLRTAAESDAVSLPEDTHSDMQDCCHDNSSAATSDISHLRFHIRQYLKDTVLSCTEEEVNQCLEAFFQTQASMQTSVFRDELRDTMRFVTNYNVQKSLN